MNLKQAEARVANAQRTFETVLDKIDRLPDDASDAVVRSLNRELDSAEASLEQAKRTLTVAQARASSPQLIGSGQIRVGREASTYRPDGSHSFFSDMYRARALGDVQAQERLNRHMAETRDVTSGDPGAVGLIPPIYLADEYAVKERAGRPFADAVPSLPMPPQGETISIPKVQIGTSVDVQSSQNSAVSETDIDTQTVSAPLVTIAGQNDVSRQSLERSFPGLDMVIFDDLVRAYDAKLDAQLIVGSGSSGQHKGIRNVSGAISVTYTDASPTAAELLPKIYGAVSQMASQRFMQPDLIVMHPRRAAWMASELSSTFPLFQQGQLMQAAGQQNNGFVGSIAGLNVLLDPNVPTNLGAGTNEDEIYVLYSPDLRLAEDNVRQATYEEVLSGSLTVRLQVYAFSFFVPDRYAKSTAIISGTGLVAPAGF